MIYCKDLRILVIYQNGFMKKQKVRINAVPGFSIIKYTTCNVHCAWLILMSDEVLHVTIFKIFSHLIEIDFNT